MPAGGLTPAQKKQVRDMVKGGFEQHVETKHAINDSAAADVLTTGTLADITLIGQGATQDTRVGDRILLKKLTLRAKMVASAGGLLVSADAYDTIRLIVFRWWGDNAVDVPGLSKILELGNNDTDYTVASHNQDDKEMFTIISDETFVVYNTTVYNGSALAVEPGPGHVAIVTKSLPIKGDKHVYYNVGANSGSGHLYLLSVSDSGFTPHPKLNFSMLLEYEDA